jgi:hypothetical protein
MTTHEELEEAKVVWLERISLDRRPGNIRQVLDDVFAAGAAEGYLMGHQKGYEAGWFAKSLEVAG